MNPGLEEQQGYLERATQALKQFFSRRRTAYVTTFAGPPGEAVLRDLAEFCRAHKSTAHLDPHMAARLDGRREVWLRISSYLNLSDEQLWQLYGKQPN